MNAKCERTIDIAICFLFLAYILDAPFLYSPHGTLEARYVSETHLVHIFQIQPT